MADSEEDQLTTEGIIAFIMATIVDARTAEDEEEAILLGLLAMRILEDKVPRSGKYGPRGPYDQEKTDALFERPVVCLAAQLPIANNCKSHPITDYPQVSI